MEAEERNILDDNDNARGQKKTNHRRKCSQDAKLKNTNLSSQAGGGQHHHHHHGIGTQVLKPRISKLEHLEAKMASIEVSLSNGMELGLPLSVSTARSKGGAVPSAQEHSTEQSQDVARRNLNVASNERLRKFADEIEHLRDSLREKDAIIGALREQTNQLISVTTQTNNAVDASLNGFHVRSENRLPTADEMQAKECRLKQLQGLIDNKICSVKEIRMKLNSLQVNDLDSRIHQAELECLLEREEMNILNLRQEQVMTKTTLYEMGLADETRFHHQQQQLLADTTAAVTFYSIVSCSQCTSLVAVDIVYDVQAPCFYVTTHHSGRGLFVQWAKDTTKMKKGDRLLEINGKIVAGCTKDQFLDLLWSLSNNGNVLKAVILRNTPMLPTRRGTKEVDSLKEEMSSIVNKLDTKIKENKELHLSLQKLQKDDEQHREECQRLNHRTLFLEDQVAELLRLQRIGSETTSIRPEPKQAGNCLVSVLPFSSTPRVNSSVVKSLSVSRLDSIHVQTTLDHHVLQVQIPFVSNEQQVPSCASAAEPVVYTNVPFPAVVSKGGSEVHLRGRHCRGSADSDSGDYSGDSMDDAFVQNAEQRLDSVDHGYVNLIESHRMREAVTLGTVRTSKSVVDRKRNESWPSMRACSDSCGRRLLSSSDGQSRKAVVQLRVNQMSKDEEWC